MQAATAAGPVKRITLLILGLALALAVVLLFPPLSAPMAFIMPLVVCPLQFSQGLWASVLLSFVPCAGALLTGGDLPLSLLLPLCPLICLPLTQWASRRKIAFFLVAALLCGLALLTQTLWWGRMMMLLGGDLFAGLAERAVAALSALPNSGNLLYTLAQAGLLEVPAQFQHNAVLPLGGLVILNPALRTELLNALRFQLYAMLKTGIPSLLVQSSLIVGLFTALRSSRGIARQAAALPGVEAPPMGPQPLPYPQFRDLRLPKAYRGYVISLALAALALALIQGEVPALMSALTMGVFITVYRLLGASALVFLLCRRNPDNGFWAGLLACALYLTFPTLLLGLGLADQFMDLRTAAFHHHEED